MPRILTPALALVALAPALAAQEVEIFCDPLSQSFCIHDTLEVVFTDTGSSALDGKGLPPGSRIEAGVVTETKSSRISGWSYAVKHDEEFLTVTSASTEGTIVDPDHPDAVFFRPGFDATQIVEGGWISALVLSFGRPTELPVNERNLIATAVYELERSPGPEGTLIRIVDDELGVEGAPYTGIAWTVGGITHFPEILVHAVVTNTESFLRGDANADGKRNIVDPIFTLQHLFNGQEPPSCLRSADADDNGEVELTDAVYTLGHLFDGQPPPPEPFAQCGGDPTPDELTCDAFPPCKAGGT